MVDRPPHARLLRVAVNATAYDAAPSGARNRTVGLCAELLRAGVHLDVFSAAELDFGALVAKELGEDLPRDAWRERRSPFRPADPIRRAIAGPPWFRSHLSPDRHDLFLTDYFPVLTVVPTALSIHDLRDLDRPLPGAMRGRRGRAQARRAVFNTVYPTIARRAGLVLTLTEALAKEVSARLRVPPDRIVVVHPGVSRLFRSARPADGPASHLLAVGVADERKGIRLLCQAMRMATRSGSVLPLVMTGRLSGFVRDVLDEHSDLRARGALRYEGVVSDERLIELYRGAAALLHPSRYEGFGIPVLEAMTLGTPVVVAPDPAVQEVAGPAATYVAAADVAAWADVMVRYSDPATAPTRPDEAAMTQARAAGWDEGARRFLAAAATLTGRTTAPGLGLPADLEAPLKG